MSHLVGRHGKEDGPHVPECSLQPNGEALKQRVEGEREAQERRSECGVDKQFQREVVVVVLMLVLPFVVVLDCGVGCCRLGGLCLTLFGKQRPPLVVRVGRDIQGHALLHVLLKSCFQYLFLEIESFQMFQQLTKLYQKIDKQRYLPGTRQRCSPR